jgi:hypothetical protein
VTRNVRDLFMVPTLPGFGAAAIVRIG